MNDKLTVAQIRLEIAKIAYSDDNITTRQVEAYALVKRMEQALTENSAAWVSLADSVVVPRQRGYVVISKREFEYWGSTKLSQSCYRCNAIVRAQSSCYMGAQRKRIICVPCGVRLGLDRVDM